MLPLSHLRLSRSGLRPRLWESPSGRRPRSPKIFTHRGTIMRAMTGFNALREHSRITWIEQEHGWAATPEDIVTVLSNEGFEECKREQTTSRRNRRPAGGLWQGVNPRTGSVASAIWVNRPAWPHDIVFIEVDGESFGGDEGGSGDPWTEPLAPVGTTR